MVEVQSLFPLSIDGTLSQIKWSMPFSLSLGYLLFFFSLIRSQQAQENICMSPNKSKSTHAVGSSAAVSVRRLNKRPKIILASSPGVPAPSATLLVRPKSA